MIKYPQLRQFMKTFDVLCILSEEVSAPVSDVNAAYFTHIQTTANVEESLQIFKEHFRQSGKYHDIVIVDTALTDAVELYKTISRENDDQSILVIAEPGDHFELFKEECISNFVTKPVNKDVFEANLLQIASVRWKKKQIRQQLSELETFKKNAEEASRQKSYFLANMSHEIRTPLNAIMGFITLLSQKEDDEEKRRYLQILQDSSASLLKVINDILDITKIESGNLEIDRIPFNPYGKLMQTIELYQEKAAEDGVIFKAMVSKQLPKTLLGDPFRIQQIFANLLSNAIKFTPEGSVVKVMIWYKNGFLNIRVKDYGIGIVKEKHQYIFKAFHQADNRMATEYGGTGLGLALCSELSGMMNGSLSFEENKKGGSIFALKLKLPEAEEIPKKAEDNISEEEKPPLKGHILVVEDIEANRLFIEILLSQYGLTCDMAENGFEAVDRFKEQRYDLILMDENMPKLNGVDAAKRIAKYEKEKKLRHTPIITLTANALKGDKERLLNAGMDCYLGKPFHPDELYRVLRKFL